MSELLNLFPAHKCSLTLEHNPHKNNYESIQQYCENLAQFDFDDDTWVSLEQKQKAIQRDCFWELHWYPRTPIGFYKLWACDLDVLLMAAREIKI